MDIKRILELGYYRVSPSDIGEGAQIIDTQWYMPLWGCDTLQHIVDEYKDDSKNITDEISRLKDENKKLRIAARLIHQRNQVQSGSKEMAYIDSFCKDIGLRVWEWSYDGNWFACLGVRRKI